MSPSLIARAKKLVTEYQAAARLPVPSEPQVVMV